MKYPRANLIDAVNSNLSSTAAAKMFNVPARTIRSHRQIPLQKIGAGRSRYLDDDEESFLISIFQILPNYGFSLTADTVINISCEYMKSLGLPFVAGRK